MAKTEYIFLLGIIILSACSVQSIPRIVYKSLSSDSGLIFYDLESNRTLLPPVVTALPYGHEQQREPLQVTSRRPMFPMFRRPCSCNELNCGCCAGINFKQFNFRRQMCTNFTYDPNEFAILMDVMMNEDSLYHNMVSAKNPEPICIPVPYVPGGVDMCIKLFNIFTPGRNLHMCMDLQARVAKAPIIVLHFDCMRMGQNGFALVKPDQNGGLDIPEVGDAGNNPGNESETPPVSSPSNTQTGGSSSSAGAGIIDVDPPQTDYDIYDEITEIKIS